LLKDSSYITIEVTLRKLVKLYPAKTQTYLDATQGVRAWPKMCALRGLK